MKRPSHTILYTQLGADFSLRWAIGTLLLGSLVGCHVPATDSFRENAACVLAARTGHPLHSPAPPGQIILPPGVCLQHGLNDEEAVAVALMNNAAFQELLVDLKVAHSDLVQANLLPDPEFYYSSGVTDKPFRYLVDFSVESLWLRPIRLAAAGREMSRTEQRMIQAGLDLIRDVRQALADVRLAQGRAAVAEESSKLRNQVASIAETRLKAGDATPQEAATARIDGMQAAQDAKRLTYDVLLADERLRNLLGLSQMKEHILLVDHPLLEIGTVDLEALVQEATRERPDAQAATWGVESAKERLRLAKVVWFKVLGIADATSGTNNHIMGPAFRFTIPIFNWNQGGIEKAEADLERAERLQITLSNQIVMEVRQANLRYEQASRELQVLDSKILPEAEASIGRADKAFREGNASLLLVLEATRQMLDSQLRQVQLRADVKRSWVELERSTGRRLKVPHRARLLPPR